MKNLIISATVLLFLLISIDMTLAYEKIYDMQILFWNTGEINLTYAKVLEGYKTIPTDSPTKYYLKVYSEDKELYSLPFFVSFNIMSDPPVSISSNNTLIELKVPFFANADTIKIFKSGVEIFSFKTSNFCRVNGICEKYESEISCPADCSTSTPTETNPINISPSGCGNSVCDPTETYLSCPQDCKSGSRDGYCDMVKDGICDPDCAPNKDPDCIKTIQKREDNSSKLLIAALVAICIILVLAFLIIRAKVNGER
ncbi:MAG: hypothetical protein QXW00_00320 [Candidatus Woesearchaeota archaeon]